MAVGSNSCDILQNGLHQNDFFINFQEFQNIDELLRASVIRSAIHREPPACAFLDNYPFVCVLINT